MYAIYELAKYKIEYAVNGGDLFDANQFEYTVNDMIILASAERDYHIFEGWYDNPTFDGEKVTEIAKDSVGDKKFFAKWKEMEYTVTYVLNGGINDPKNVNRADGTYVYTVSSEDLILHSPEMSMFTFAGWVDERGERIIKITADTPKNITLYAEWESTRYNIVYVLNGGINSEDNPLSYTADDEEIELSDPTREGYIFIGWYDNEYCIGESITAIYGYVCEDVILYAKWEKS